MHSISAVHRHLLKWKIQTTQGLYSRIIEGREVIDERKRNTRFLHANSRDHHKLRSSASHSWFGGVAGGRKGARRRRLPCLFSSHIPMLCRTSDTHSPSGDPPENSSEDAPCRSLHVPTANNCPLLQKRSFQRCWRTSTSRPRRKDKPPPASAASARSRSLKGPHRQRT